MPITDLYEITSGTFYKAITLIPVWLQDGIVPAAPVVLMIFIFMTGVRGWKIFAVSHQWASRGLLFCLSLCLPLSLFYVTNSVFITTPVKISIESPNLTISAIKLGLYGLYYHRELEVHLTPNKVDLEKCVAALSIEEAKAYENNCGDNRACYEHIPAMSKENMIAKIKESQTTHIVNVSDACKNANVAGL
jgi:hypothetical protein